MAATSSLSKAPDLILPELAGRSAGVAPPMPREDGSGGRTMIIFDWDDTLLCSSALRQSHRQPTPEVMKQLERAVEAILLTAMSLGETLIVTNGTQSWVRDSATCFVPGLLPILERVTTISARAKNEYRFPEDPFAWKREVFQELLDAMPGADATPDHPSMRFGGHGGTRVNLIVIGDSWYEIEAARSTFGRAASTTVKTLKFKEVPTVPELLGQLRRSSQELSRLVACEASVSLGLAAKPLPEHLEVLVACASAWEVAEESDGSFQWSTAPPASPLLQPTPLLSPQDAQGAAGTPEKTAPPPNYFGTDASGQPPARALDFGTPAPLGGQSSSGLSATPPAPLPEHGAAGGKYHIDTVEHQRCGKVF